MIDGYRMSRKSDLRSRRKMMALLDGRLRYTRSKSLNHTFKMMALLDGRLRYTLKIVKSHFQNDSAARR